MNIKKQAFTLIELLVVIAIIGLLAGAVSATLNSARESAQSARVIQDMRAIEKGFQITYLHENRTTWWSESELGMSNPTLQQILNIDSGPLEKFSENIPYVPEFFIDGTLRFDNDDNVNNGCAPGGVQHSGVNLLIMNEDLDNIYALNDFFDGKEESNPIECGKIRWDFWGNPTDSGTANLFYSLDGDGEW